MLAWLSVWSEVPQLMPLPLTVSCFSKIQIGFTFLVPAHLGGPGQRAVKWMCVCVCVCVLSPAAAFFQQQQAHGCELQRDSVSAAFDQ